MSTSVSLTERATTSLIEERNAEMLSLSGSCACVESGLIRTGFAVAAVVLIVAGTIETLARAFFAFVTLPAYSSEFYKRVSVGGLLSTLTALAILTRALFDNLCTLWIAVTPIQKQCQVLSSDLVATFNAGAPLVPSIVEPRSGPLSETQENVQGLLSRFGNSELNVVGQISPTFQTMIGDQNTTQQVTEKFTQALEDPVIVHQFCTALDNPVIKAAMASDEIESVEGIARVANKFIQSPGLLQTAHGFAQHIGLPQDKLEQALPGIQKVMSELATPQGIAQIMSVFVPGLATSSGYVPQAEAVD